MALGYAGDRTRVCLTERFTICCVTLTKDRWPLVFIEHEVVRLCVELTVITKSSAPLVRSIFHYIPGGAHSPCRAGSSIQSLCSGTYYESLEKLAVVLHQVLHFLRFRCPAIKRQILHRHILRQYLLVGRVPLQGLQRLLSNSHHLPDGHSGRCSS